MDINTDFNKALGIKNKLYRMALVMLQDSEEAKDVVQDVYLKMLSDNITRQTKNAEAYAMQSVKNKCIDMLRARKPTQSLSSDWEIADTIMPYQKLEFDNLKSLIVKMMGTLPEQQRMVMQLRDIEQYTYEEIENITGMPVNSIRVALSRARKNIRSGYKKLKDYEERGSDIDN